MVLNLPPENKPCNVVYNVFSELTQTLFLLIFRIIFTESFNRKVLRENWKLNKISCWKSSKKILEKLQFNDNFSRKSREKSNCTESWNAETQKLVRNQILPKISTENQFCAKFKFVKIQHCIQQRFKLIATSVIICNSTVV